LNDVSLMGLIARGNEKVFDQLFTDWFGALYAYAFSVLGDETLAEEAVQSVFCKIWEKREQLKVHTSVKAYLYGCVYHECMNWLRHKKHIQAHRSHVLHNESHSVGDASIKAEMGELELKLKMAMDELPDQCRAIFQLSRFGGLKYQEIAGQLNISVKTVESQVSKALKHLRIKLSDFLP
jgi:RNA polymerase sigma-70 factor, ECF subfamily